mgnify:FL=1
MSAIQLHRVIPESSSDNYLPYQSVDFLLDAKGRKLIKGSIRIEGDCQASDAVGGARITNASNVKLENHIGFHAFFDSFTVETEGAGVLENLQNYGRYQNMVSRSSNTSDDLLSSQFVAEGRGPVPQNGNYVLQKVADNSFIAARTTPIDGAGDNSADPSFSLRPSLCFNRAAGDDYSFSKNGFIRVSCILSPAIQALFGGAAPAKDYVLKNLALRYQTRQDDGQQGVMMMKSYINVVSSVQSTSTTVSARVPSKSVNGVAMSFVAQADVNDGARNSYELQNLPQWENIEFLFNNSLNEYLTYVVRDQSDALSKGLEAMESAGHSSVSSTTLKANNGTIFGLKFSEYIDLSNQRFTTNFKVGSDSITSNAMDVHLYFSTLLTM